LGALTGFRYSLFLVPVLNTNLLKNKFSLTDTEKELKHAALSLAHIANREEKS
jgi:hypothetical protein